MPHSQARDEGDALLSIVVPLFNERENIRLLYEGITGVCQGLAKPYEIVMVDDGSTDGTLDVLRELHSKDRRVKVVTFRRNFGQTAAMAAGLDFASGHTVVTMDGDLQNDPADIPRLVKKMDEGYDLVNGWRADRKDKFLSRRLPSIIANWLIGLTTGIKLHDYGCSLKAYRIEVVKNMNLYGEMHRFIPALANRVGANIAEVKVTHHPRKYGRSKYGIFRTYKVLMDLTTVNLLHRFPSNPLSFFGLLSSVLLFAGSSAGGYGVYAGYVLNQDSEAGLWMLLGALLVIVGLQFVFLGFCSELILRTGRTARERLYRTWGLSDAKS